MYFFIIHPSSPCLLCLVDLPEVTGTHRKFRSIVSSLIALKHSPSKRQGKRDSIKKLSSGADTTDEKATSSNPSAAPTSTSAAASAANISHGNELGHLRGFGAISAAIKSSKLLSEQETAQSFEESNPASPETAVDTGTGNAAISPVAAVDSAAKTTLPAASNLMGIYEETADAAATTYAAGGNGYGDAENPLQPFDGKTSSFRFDSSCLNSIQPGMLVGNNPEAETLNIPAVLWDRPVGSSKRVPPPVPPRSPRRPYDHSISFAAASDTAAFRGNASQQRPDVVPGADTEDSTTSGLSTSGLSNNPVSGGSSKIGSRPKHKRQEQIQQPAYNHSSLGDLRNSENEPHPSPAASSVNQGTPSHLSIGTSSLYTTTGWTEGTPSYTESSMSGSLGRYSADPGQMSSRMQVMAEDGFLGNHHNCTSSSLGSRINCTNSIAKSPVLRKNFQSSSSSPITVMTMSDGRVERRLETCSYQETEM